MGMQGSSSELRRVEVTVVRAENLPDIRRWLRMKRRFFVTVSDEATTKTSSSVLIDGEVVKWNEQLDAFFVHPSSRLVLRLYAKRFLHRDILVGKHEIPPSVVSTSDLSFDLSQGNDGQARQATRPVMIHVSVNTSPSPSMPTSPIGPPEVGLGMPHTDTVAEPTVAHSQTETAAPTEPRTDRLPIKANPPQVDTVETSPIRNSLYNSNEAPKMFKAGRRQESMKVPHEPTIDDIIQTVKRFRILSIGRSGVGKSSLINSVFGINAARVEEYKVGEADIKQELVSPENQFFVLHDSKGFEPGDLSNFEIVREFVQQRSRNDIPLSERIHGLWLCTVTPTAGGRVFETGDEKLLQFAHKNQVPIVIVFTQYDRLVRTKEAELRQKYPSMEQTARRDRSVEEARMAFEYCLELLKRSMKRLKIPMPRYAAASVRPGHQEDVSELVQVTRDIVEERVKGDAWVLWSIAQRKSLPLKIDACVTKGISYYRQALMGTLPGSEELLLHHCLETGHKNIITCWNFKGEVLNSPEFQQLMLCLVQDVYTRSNVSNPPAVDVNVINQFVTLVINSSAPTAPPVAIPGLTNILQLLSTTVLENTPSVQRLLIAHAVDLISVLRELFDITLRRPELGLTTTWSELQEAFKAYELSRQDIHKSICSKTTRDEQTLTADCISEKDLRELLEE